MAHSSLDDIKCRNVSSILKIFLLVLRRLPQIPLIPPPLLQAWGRGVTRRSYKITGRGRLRATDLRSGVGIWGMDIANEPDIENGASANKFAAMKCTKSTSVDFKIGIRTSHLKITMVRVLYARRINSRLSNAQNPPSWNSKSESGHPTSK